MNSQNGSHPATEPSSRSLQSLPGGSGARTLEAGPGTADPRVKPIRAGIQQALWRMVDNGRADHYLGVALNSMEQGELVALAAAALARLERIELENAA